MADITEIIEESAVQLEIVESGGGQIEIVEGNSTVIEIVETTLSSNDLDIATQINTVVIESTPPTTTVDVSVQDPTTVEATITNNVIEITENQVLNVATQSISQQITTVVQQTTQSVVNQQWDGQRDGDASITGSLIVSNTLFTDVLSASIAQFTGDGINNILIISSGSSSPITVNSEGLIIFDEFLYTPTPVEGGMLYSGSNFYLGFNSP
jgi:hypothetical protein